MYHSCDTLVLIGYCMQEADRLWVPSKALFERPKDEVNTVAVPSAYVEFDLVIDGIGGSGDGDGILGGLVRQLEQLSRLLDQEPGLAIDKALGSLNLTPEEANRLSRWLTARGASWAQGLSMGPFIREMLYDFEMGYIRARHELRMLCPLSKPADEVELDRVFGLLTDRWDGGASWYWDKRIISETHCLAKSDTTFLVTEDRGHMGKRKDGILELTKIKDILDMSLRSL
jgi:hypothetical protein